MTTADSHVWGIASGLITGLATGLATAVVSVRLAYRRFRHERTWERKLQAYSEIFEALFHVRSYTRVEITRIEEGGSYNSSYMKQLGDNATAGFNAIRKAAVIGTLVVGEDAAKLLEKLAVAFDDPHYNDDHHEELSSDLGAVEKAIEKLRPIARRDLQLD